ncbi:MAG: hypothetical protein CMD49_03980 [Gammaproteobacteria bacterium]|nr:hypothetical protein [Gammaproteobacteria bacterium]|tara:strand:- start:72 stop:563 length:492 start_codon:yes stop_codon:yes gene_type:complete
MPVIDIIISFFILFWIIIGLSKGFVNELISLLCWGFALYFSVNYNNIPAEYIFGFVKSPELSMILAFILIFLVAFIASLFLGFFSTQLVKVLGFAYSNTILGLLVGFIKGNVFVIIIIYGLSLTEFTSTTYWGQSHFIPFFDDFIHKFIKSHDSLFDSLDLKI